MAVLMDLVNFIQLIVPEIRGFYTEINVSFLLQALQI